MIKRIFFILTNVWVLGQVVAQYHQVGIEKMQWERHPKVHSGVIAPFGGKWIIIGGRTNGLHGYQTPSAFPMDGIQDSVFVVNPSDLSVKSAPLSLITDVDIREQLKSANMLFCTDGNRLLVAGGYGYRAALNNYITFPYLTVIDMDCLVNAVETGSDFNACFSQVYDENMAVAGAHMRKMGDYFYLVFGHRFDGMYATTSTGVFTQLYTNAIRKFKLSATTPYLVSDYSEVVDTANYHRRDYNLTEQVFSDGSVGLSAFSGVFQYGVDLPFENITDINSNGTGQPFSGFAQKLNHYHSALMPVYDSVEKVMLTYFFGGMSRYKYSSQLGLIEDTLVPFVKTVSCIKRYADNSVVEEFANLNMPGFEGTNAEFIPLSSVPKHQNTHIIRFDEVVTQNNQQFHVGYIVGGILSEDENVFLQNGVSEASNAVYKVFLIRNTFDIAEQIVKAPFEMAVFPNPGTGQFTLEIKGDAGLSAEAIVYDAHGRTVKKRIQIPLNPASGSQVQLNLTDLKPGNYILKLRANQYAATSKIVIVD